MSDNPFKQAAGDSPSPLEGSGKTANLTLRLATAVVGLPILALMVYLGGWPFAFAATAIAFLAATEFVHGWLMPTMPIPAALAYAPTYGVTALAVGGVHADPKFGWLGIAFGLLFAGLGYAPTSLFGPRKPWKVYSWCVAYIGVLLSALVLLRDGGDGRSWVFLALLATFATDTGAYAVGRLIGRHKMAPKISPKKTWEGAVGGYIAGAGACIGLSQWFDLGVTVSTILPLALTLPIFAQVGDLLESWFKRRMEVKDASGLLPGHGGFLDRLDSVLFVAPLVYLFVRLRIA